MYEIGQELSDVFGTKIQSDTKNISEKGLQK
jgi:hypothetical protein